MFKINTDILRIDGKKTGRKLPWFPAFFQTQASEELTFDGRSQHLSLSVGMAVSKKLWLFGTSI